MKKTSRHWLPALFALVTAAELPAQAVTPEPPEPTSLSPFQVTSTKDSGYTAANSLAGGRMATPAAGNGQLGHGPHPGIPR